MLNGDCNACINRELPSHSATCVECGLLRKNYKPMTNTDKLMDDVKVEPFEYDEEEIHPNCTVQIWRNSKTGEVSIGWWKKGED